jgi:asparagine synthase (glutamine-hydrolysing)
VSLGILERMRDALTHRGPDDAGSFREGNVGLGIRRLSIIDVEAGHQPILTKDGSLAIVFNGEIYNYLELRRDYLSGYEFSTDSDTEVILHLYARFGENCVQLLNGMFAFAIWDRNKRKLFLARDRLGIKPLYYTVQNGSFIFGSEIKALLQHPKVSVETSAEGVDQFMTYGYVLTPATIFKDIYRVPEGHTLTWHRGQFAIRQYWKLRIDPQEDVTEAEHIERILEILKDSVRLRMRSDVPVGMLLSGGIDSSTITALVTQSAGKLKTFSIGFDTGKDFNELSYARTVAEKFGTDHHELVLDTRLFADFFPRFIHYMDEPVTEGPGITLYFLSQFAARHVKVVLSGEGADELFAGYPIYQYMKLIERYRSIPQAMRKGILNPLLRTLWPSTKIGKYTYLSELPLERRYLNVNLYDIRLRERLYTKGFRRELNDFDPLGDLTQIYKKSGSADVLAKMLYVDTKEWLPNDILIKADRMSMAASLELRCPFLDYRVVEYAATIPSRYKLRYGQTKYILRQAIADLVPKQVLRRPKMGFPVPMAAMFRNDLRSYAEDVLLDPQTQQRGFFDPVVVQNLLREHMEGTADHHAELWRLLILEQWHRQFVDSFGMQRAKVATAQNS